MNKQKLINKKIALYTMLPTALLFLSGCMRLDKDGNPSGWMSELIYNYLVIPLNGFLHFLAGHLGSYALALIVLTIITRVIIIPLGIKQQRSMIESQVKMEKVKPLTDEVQKLINETNDPQQKQMLQLELAKIYKQYGIGIGNQLAGCLPLFLQMPIFVAILHVVHHSQEIANATFLGIQLGQRSVILAILVGLIYFIQSKLIIPPTSKEQQKMNNSMALTTPIMFLFISLSGPAGSALYWLIGGLIGIAQQVVINHYYRPRIKAEVEEKYKDLSVDIPAGIKQMKVENSAPQTTFAQKQSNRKRRNEGMQRRNRKK
ncbi:membrane protein insertase YidC [Allofustis seminis]|uniref:membrane protein insertase YidC n=1 Tax=Allofustis seminis TaxID=166939 RepID=UPI000368BAF1|nr:membrane protein insertase YidC [Allofustis seminis]